MVKKARPRIKRGRAITEDYRKESVAAAIIEAAAPAVGLSAVAGSVTAAVAAGIAVIAVIVAVAAAPIPVAAAEKIEQAGPTEIVAAYALRVAAAASA